MLVNNGADRCKGEGTKAEAWFRQGKKGQKPWGDGSRGRWLPVTFPVDMLTLTFSMFSWTIAEVSTGMIWIVMLLHQSTFSVERTKLKLE